MTAATVIAVWLALGVLGSALALEFCFRRNRNHPTDVEVGDILFGIVVAVFGPINFAVGCFFAIEWIVSGSVDTRRIVFKRKMH